MGMTTGDAVAKALHAAGIVPDPNTIRRVVIDLQAGQVAVLHLELLADVRILDVVPTLAGVEVRTSRMRPTAADLAAAEEAVTLTINDVRAGQNLPPVEWGNVQWKPLSDDGDAPKQQ